MRSPALVVVFLAYGCGHKVESPKPTTAGVSPRLACDAQLTSPITVTGDRFTPLPASTLKDHVQLHLPQVSLTETEDLAGMSVSPMSIPIFDDPNAPATSHIRWESEQQLSFDVYPQLMLTPGVYDVTVKNPDGQSAVFADGLAVVPPPSVTAVVPANVCDAQSAQVVMVNGSNFLEVGSATPQVTILDGSGMAIFTAGSTPTGCTVVAAQVMDGISECSSLDFTIPEGAIPVGSYTLVVTNPAPAACASTEAVAFVVEPPPTLVSVLPNHICSGGGTLALKGTGFLPGAMASLFDSMDNTSYTAQSTTVTDDMDATARFFSAGGLPVGDQLDVTIQNADGCFATLPKAVTVQQGPIIFYVDPPFVYGAHHDAGHRLYHRAHRHHRHDRGRAPAARIRARVPARARRRSISPAARRSTPTTPSAIIVDVPPSVPPGSYDLLINQASGCSAFYPNAITVETDKTDLKDILPPFGFDQASTDVTIDATGAFFAPGVRAYIAPTIGANPLAVRAVGGGLQSATQITAIVTGVAGQAARRRRLRRHHRQPRRQDRLSDERLHGRPASTAHRRVAVARAASQQLWWRRAASRRSRARTLPPRRW